MLWYHSERDDHVLFDQRKKWDLLKHDGLSCEIISGSLREVVIRIQEHAFCFLINTSSVKDINTIGNEFQRYYLIKNFLSVAILFIKYWSIRSRKHPILLVGIREQKLLEPLYLKKNNIRWDLVQIYWKMKKSHLNRCRSSDYFALMCKRDN